MQYAVTLLNANIVSTLRICGHLITLALIKRPLHGQDQIVIRSCEYDSNGVTDQFFELCE